MVCDDVKRSAYLFLDGVLESTRISEFQSHLNDCEGCDERMRVQQKLRTFYRKRLAPTVAPSHLRQKISTALGKFREGGLDVEWA
jgi:mycothiol system anti-sigma-R factor